MKVCPVCTEQVNDPAKKCPHCHEWIESPPALQTDEQKLQAAAAVCGRHVWIVDSQYMRMGQFLGAILAAFTVVGISLYGVKLDSMQENLSKATERVQKQESELAEKIKKLNGTITDLEGQAELLPDKIAEITRSIQVADSTGRLLKFDESQTAVSDHHAAEVIDAHPELARDDGTHFWKKRATLPLKFLNGKPHERKMVEDVLAEWTKYCELNFPVVSDDSEVIRVKFDVAAGSWAYLGTQCLLAEGGEPNINLYVSRNPSTDEDRGRALHEFGHVLGLIHEHQNPAAKLRWNREAVYRYFTSTQGWDKAAVEDTILNPYTKSDLGKYRDFDPSSIMMYPFPRTVFEKGFDASNIPSVPNQKLSNSDKELVRRIYVE